MLLTREKHAKIIEAMITTGQVVLCMQKTNRLNARKKPDGSAITDADLLSHHMLKAVLENLLPNCPIISEEDKHHDRKGRYTEGFIIDPVDCTGDLCRGGSRFALFVGYVNSGIPLHGFAYFPAPKHGVIYFTGLKGMKAYRQKIDIDSSGKITYAFPTRLQTQPANGELRMAQMYTDAKDLCLHPYSLPVCSAPNRILSMLEGQVDVTAGCDAMNDWDLASVDAIARKSGAVLVSVESKSPLVYGQERTPDRAFKQPRYIAGNVQTLQKLGLLRV